MDISPRKESRVSKISLMQVIIRFQSYLEPYIERYREFFSFTGTDVG